MAVALDWHEFLFLKRHHLSLRGAKAAYQTNARPRRSNLDGAWRAQDHNFAPQTFDWSCQSLNGAKSGSCATVESFLMGQPPLFLATTGSDGMNLSDSPKLILLVPTDFRTVNLTNSNVGNPVGANGIRPQLTHLNFADGSWHCHCEERLPAFKRMRLRDEAI